MFKTFIKHGENANARIEVSRRKVGKVPQGRGEKIKERRVRKAMIPSHDEAIA